MMSRVFAENENRDIFLNANNQIGINDGLAALSQAAKASIEIQLGEATLGILNGMPTESVAWSGAPNLQQFEFFARKQILAVEGVNEVSVFDASVSGDVLSYQATIKTIFGEDVISGSV